MLHSHKPVYHIYVFLQGVKVAYTENIFSELSQHSFQILV